MKIVRQLPRDRDHRGLWERTYPESAKREKLGDFFA